MATRRTVSTRRRAAEEEAGPKGTGRAPSAAAGKARKSKRGKSEALLSIGELAELTNVSTRTIRYYEELGILPPPERTTGGTRRYPRDYIFYVEGARTLKQLGFGLEEIAELGKFALTGASASSRTQAILKEKLSELEHRIRVLNRLYELVNEAASAPRKPEEDTAVPELLRWVSEGNGKEADSGLEAS